MIPVSDVERNKSVTGCLCQYCAYELMVVEYGLIRQTSGIQMKFKQLLNRCIKPLCYLFS